VAERPSIAERIAAHQDRAARAQVAVAEQQYMYFRPLQAAANNLLDELRADQRRVYFGLPDLDDATKGIGPGELCYLTGRAHSGKSMLLANVLNTSRDLHTVYFTPDETDALVLARLVSLMFGISYDDLEERIQLGDSKTARIVQGQAAEAFPYLAVYPQSLTFPEMTVALREYEQGMQAEAHVLMLDYLDLLPGRPDYTGTKSKSVGVKNWVKEHHLAGLVIHQANRNTQRGERIGMDSMSNAGETEATFTMGVDRRRDSARATDEERLMHTNTITVNLDKNKRPPCRTGVFDFYLHPTTGFIRPLSPTDMLVPGVEIPDARTAALLHQQMRDSRVIELASRRDLA
jgi:hypothetical protein